MESNTMMQKGEAAPDFSLVGVDGKTYSRGDFGGKCGMFVLFMCNHCPYVKARMEEVVALHKEFSDSVAFVCINSSDPEYPGEGLKNSQDFAQERGIVFPYLMDEEGTIAKNYGATCTPDPFLFDADNKLVFHGRIVDALEPQQPVSERVMHGVMKKLVAGEAIEPWFDPSVGCSIKFKS
jgi:peroxiredoxin